MAQCLTSPNYPQHQCHLHPKNPIHYGQITLWNIKHIQYILQQTFGQSAMTTTNSTKHSLNSYQAGNTVTTIVGSDASQVLSLGQDPSGMGWWSYMEMLGKLDKGLICHQFFMLAHKPCKSALKPWAHNRHRFFFALAYANPSLTCSYSMT